MHIPLDSSSQDGAVNLDHSLKERPPHHIISVLIFISSPKSVFQEGTSLLGADKFDQFRVFFYKGDNVFLKNLRIGNRKSGYIFYFENPTARAGV